MNSPIKSKGRLRQWVEKRWPLSPVLRWGTAEEIPGGTRFAYVLGSATLVLFVVLVITGVWQLLYYAPTVDHAYDSVMFLRLQVPLGWLIHGLHYWSAQAFIVVMGIHVVRVFIWAAYKKPRELTWVLGVVLLLLGAAFIFTGSILPWDTTGYWAGTVGTNMAGTVPLIGKFLKLLLRGGDAMGQMTLSRSFAVHVAILPALTAFFIALHLVAFRQFGSVGPWKPKKPAKTGSFWPDQTFKDLVAVGLIVMALICLSAFVRAPISGPADPLDSSSTPKPEWNFLFLYEALKAFRGSWEWIGTVVIPTFLILLLFAVPFIDRNEKKNPFHRPVAMLSGFIFVAVILVMTFIGYYSGSSGNGSTASASTNQTATASASAAAPATPAATSPVSTNAPAPAADAPAPTNQVAAPTTSAATPATPEGAPPVSTNAPAPAATASAPTNQVAVTGASDASPAAPESAAPVSTNAPAPAAAASAPTNQVVAPTASAATPATPPASTNAPAPAVASSAPTNQVAAPATAASPAKTEAGQTNTSTSAAHLQEGKGFFTSAGCAACHKIEGKGGTVGPDLSNEAKLGRTPQWLITQITDPKKHNPSTTMPAHKSLTEPQHRALADYILNPSPGGGGATATTSGLRDGSQPTPDSSASHTRLSPGDQKNPVPANATTVKAGAAIYQNECLACHGSTGKGDGPAAIALLKRIPDLSAPTMLANSDGAVFGKVTLGLGEMPKFESLLTVTQRWEVVNYVRTLSPKPQESQTKKTEIAPPVSTNAPAPAAAASAPTKQVAATAASPAATETAPPVSTNTPAPAATAPAPTNQVATPTASVATPAKPEGAPPASTNAPAPAATAPAPTNQVATLTASAATPAAPRVSTNAPAPAATAPAPTNQVAATATAANPAKPEAGQTNTTTSAAHLQEGKGFFVSAGCATCHKIEGKGGTVGPDLSNEAKLGRTPQWLITQITDPKKHNPSTTMPAHKSLTEPQHRALADYILNPSASPAAAGVGTATNADQQASASSAAPAQEKQNATNTTTGSAPPAAAAPAGSVTLLKMIGDPKHGAVLFDQECAQCHGKAGEGNVPNPGSLAGVVAPLAPIHRELFNDDPLVFTENIDRIIQHGAPSPGPNPKLMMPAFGDTHALTLPMIANIEAYILSLNGVDAAKIIHPGITPLHFVEGTVAVFALALLALGGLWVHHRTERSVQPGGRPSPEEFQTLKHEVADLQHKLEERKTGNPKDSSGSIDPQPGTKSKDQP